MKTVKKICLGFSAFLALFILSLVFSPAHKALAAPQKSDVQQCAKTLKFKNISQITCTLGSGKITLVDNNPTDQNYDHDKDYIASSDNYASESSGGAFCQDKTDYLDFSGGNFHISDAGSKKSAYLQLYYVEPDKPGCQSFAQNVTITDTSGIAILLNGGSNKAASLPDIDSSSHSLSGQSFTRYQNGSFDPKKGVALYASGIDDLESSCDGEILAVYYSGSSGATATEYDISGGGKAFSSFPNLAKLPNDTGCGVDKENFGLDNGAFKLSPAVSQISGSLDGQKCGAGQSVPNGYDCQCTHDEGGNSCVLVPGSSTTSSDQQSGTGKLDSDASCEGNSGGFPLSWALCPVLDAASSLSGKLVNLFEDQLSFKVGDLGKASQATSGAGEVRTSWSLIRDIASSLLIVIMLVMVLSQAVSFGPFDAYTIKKLLPKMVVAIIIMQVSWDLFSWVVGLFDDIGHGIANLMYVPFGGVGNMSLLHLLGNAGLNSTSGNAALGTLDWAAIGAGLFLGYAYAFTMLGFATVAIISVLAGLFTLIFRKILIIMLLILSPLALVAWILPGTASYWKMWRENFIKALSMFPIAIGIVAAGRIFAQVAGTQDNGTLIALIFVLVGFFGPLFILPKTFKWGGQAMQQAGGGIQKVGSKLAERPKKYLDKQQETWNHIRGERSADRYAHPEKYKLGENSFLKRRLGMTYKPSTLWNKPLDKARAGDWNPVLGVPGSEVRAKQRNRVLAEAEEAEAKSRSENLQRIQKTAEERLQEGAEKDKDGNVLAQKGGNKDDMYQDMLRIARGEKALKKYYDYEGNEMDLHEIMGGSHREVEAARRAALDRMIQLGADTNWSHIDAEDERIREYGTAEEKAQWRKFLNDNKDQVLEKMPDLLKGTSSVSDISAEGIARMHGAGIKRMISKLNANATEGKREGETDADVAKRQATGRAQLNKFLNTYQEAITNTNTRGLMEQGGLRAVKAYVTENPDTRRFLLDQDPYKMHADKEDGRMHIRVKTKVDPENRDEVIYDEDSPLLLKPLIAANPDGTVTGDAAAGLSAVDASIRRNLDAVIDPNGSFDNDALKRTAESSSGGGVISPGEITIQHREAAARVLPPSGSLDVGAGGAAAAANREAFKIQLQTSPEAVQALANGVVSGAIDLGSTTDQHAQVLAEMRQAAERVIADPTATDQQKAQARDGWNQIASQIQQAYLQKVEATVSHAVQSGADPATARAGAMSAVDITTRRTAAENIQALQPGGASPLSQL